MHVGSAGSTAKAHVTPAASSSPPARRPCRVVADPRDEGHLGPETGEPRGGVAAGPAGDERDGRRGVGVPPDVAGRAGDDVEPDVTDDDDRPRRPCRRRHARAADCAATSAATSPASRAFDRTSSTLARSDSPPELAWKCSSSRGVTSLPCTPSRSSRASPSATSRSCSSRSTCRSAGSGLARTTPAASVPEPVAHDDDPGRLGRRLHAPRHRVPRVRQVEARERVGPVADHRHRQGLERLERPGHVEDRLHAGAHDEDRCRRDDPEVGGDVEGLGRAAVHPAEPAGREDADAGQMGQRRRRGHGRRARKSKCRSDAHVAHRQLGDVGVGADPLDLGARRGRCARPPSSTAIVAGTDAAGPHRVLDPRADLDVVGVGEPVGEDRALEGDDADPGLERLVHLLVDDEQVGPGQVLQHGRHPSSARHRPPAGARGALAHPGQRVDEAARHPRRLGPDALAGRAARQPHRRAPHVVDDPPPLPRAHPHVGGVCRHDLRDEPEVCRRGRVPDAAPGPRRPPTTSRSGSTTSR